MASILALVRLDVLFIEALLQGELVGRRDGRGAAQQRLFCFSEVFDAETEVQKRLHLVRHTVTLLAGCGALQFTVKCLMNDAGAGMFATVLRLFTVTVALVQLFGQKLEKFVGVLLFGGDEVGKGLFFRDPEARQNVSCRITVGSLLSVKFLEHVVHGAREAV